jgi:limonene-1,2-epoxide hydrolase
MAFASRADQLEDMFAGFDGGLATMGAALERHFTKDCEWANAGLQTTHGVAEAMALQKQWCDAIGMVRVKIVTHKSVESGDVLLNERTDYMIDADGKVMFELDIAGVFVFDGDKIATWREYFDPANAQNYWAEHHGSGSRSTTPAGQ